jgi:dienelactone hydrolase
MRTSTSAAIPVGLRCLVLTALLLLAPATGANAYTIKDVTFPANVVPNTANDRRVRIKAKLYLPDAPKLPLSAVIISPSSGGVREEREVYYAQELARVGIAGLVIDSFASRGLTDSVRDQRVLGSWQTGNDAVAGFRWLAADPRFRRDKIGVMGVSKGGKVAMNMAEEVRRRWMRMTDIAFAAHVPISPDCTWINRSMQTTGAPMFFMLAEFDDQTPPAPCVEHAERLRKAGNRNVEVKVYKGASHAWERLGEAPYYDPLAQNFARCRIWIEDDNTSVDAKSGARLPRGGEFEWIKKNCMTLGTWCCGGTPALKQQATDDLIAFLRKHGF